MIAYTRHDGIYAMRPDGSGVRPLRRGGVTAAAYGLAWSPDGRKLAFAAYDAGKTTIWVMNADGTSLARLANADGLSFLGSPTWSPDGRKIAFTASEGVTGRDIWVLKADGSALRRLARTPRLWEIEVEWSPAGGLVVVSSDGYVPHVYVMSTKGGHRRRLTPQGFEAVEPSWSPDGRRIAFMRLGSSGLAHEIYVTDVGGRSRVQLTRNKVMDYHPDWSPDGSRIAFVRSDREGCWFNCPPERRASSEIYVMNADGTGVTKLTHNRVGEGSPAWRPLTRA